MATFELYRRSTIGMCLTETLDEMVQNGTLTPELAIQVLVQFDKVRLFNCMLTILVFGYLCLLVFIFSFCELFIYVFHLIVYDRSTRNSGEEQGLH